MDWPDPPTPSPRGFERRFAGGLDVRQRVVRDPQDVLQEGFDPAQIVILSCRGLKHATLAGVGRVGNQTVSRFTGQYDLLGEQIRTSGQILFDTVYRYKGQQAPAVILTDLDPHGEEMQRHLMVAYCGMTRATVRLELVARRANAWVQEVLRPAVTATLAD